MKLAMLVPAAALFASSSVRVAPQSQCRPAPIANRSGRDIVIDDVTVIPMDSERVLSEQTVIIHAGVIASVSPQGAQKPAADAVHIDGHGCVLIPGLIDMHVHLYDAEALPSYLRHGVTTVANLNGNTRILDIRSRLAAGQLVGPSLFTAGSSIDGDPPSNVTFASVADTASAHDEVRRQQRLGYDFIKVYSRLRPEEYHAIIDEARKVGIAVIGHSPVAVGIDSVLVSGQANVAHIEEFFQNPVEDSHFPALVAAAKKSGVTVTANIFPYSDYLRSIADLPAVLADPEMRYASPANFNEKLPSNNRSIRPNPENFARILRTQQARFRVLTKMLSDAGVPLFLGTDTEIYGLAGQSAQAELGELVASGLSPYRALRAATAAPGAFLQAKTRIKERRGVVVAGARADLVLLAENPLTNIRNADAVRGVLVGGRWLTEGELNRIRGLDCDRRCVRALGGDTF